MLELIDLHKSYENKPLLAGINMRIGAGETACLLGASGSGKSTLLRLVAGLEEPERGRLLWQGKNLAAVPAHERNFGLVFQDYALFPHLDVTENVAFGLRMKNVETAASKKRVAEVLEKVNMGGFEKRKVTELSGGEQQRVALARALAPKPRLLMFDEPLGALDRSLKDDLLNELRGILHETGVPAIYVTHDQEEAFGIADRILLLHNGVIVQEGSPQEVFAAPASVWVAEFLGVGNILDGEVRGDRAETPLGSFRLTCKHDHREGESIHLVISRHGAQIAAGGELGGVVTDVMFQQAGYRVKMENGFTFHLASAPEVGSSISLRLQEGAVRCLP